MQRAVLACLLLGLPLQAVARGSSPFLLRDPALSARLIAFSFGGEIWTAARDGSNARRLTTGAQAAKPAFSTDGSQIAFAGSYGGGRAIYVMPALGGAPRRLTYHPADLGSEGFVSIPEFVSWTPDGKSVLFSSRRAAFAQNVVQLFVVPGEGGFAAPIALPSAAQGALSADGERIAYVSHIQWEPAWKGYRGGQTTAIHIARLADSKVEATIPRDNSNDFNPLWIGRTIYFLSDRNGPVTLFAYDVNSRKVQQLLPSSGEDLKSASVWGDAIVYEQLGSLHILDLNSAHSRLLNIRPKVDSAEVRPHTKGISSSDIRFADLSPSGDTAVLGVRGEILTLSVEHPTALNLTNTTNVVERDPAWSPDGRHIAYFSDEAGEYGLDLRDPRGTGRPRRINLGDPPAFYSSPSWSPDSRKIGYTDQRLNYWYVDTRIGKPVRVDTDLYTDPVHGMQMAWSPDSRWIAYTKQLPNHLHAIFVYSVSEGRIRQVTDGRSDALHVVFDRGGRYLFFTAATDTGLSAGWTDMSSLDHPITRSVYAVALTKTAAPPLSLTGQAIGSADNVNIDFENIGRRMVPLPVEARNYYDLLAGRSGTLFLVEGPELDPIQPVHSAGTTGALTNVYRFDVASQRKTRILEGVSAFSRRLGCVSSLRVSFDGEKLLYASEGQWRVAENKSTADDWSQLEKTPLKVDSVRIRVDPHAEWVHMYAQVWRDERDFFYDPHLHGLNLDAVISKYAVYLEHIASRGDLNFLFREMLGEMHAGHLAAFGGDASDPVRSDIGLLGADYSVDDGRYRFARIFEGDPWDPAMRAPLTQFGMNVSVGEYLLAVNGRDASPAADVYSYFRQTAGKPVLLTVAGHADGSDARQVTVIPVADEVPLRMHGWIEKNRRLVEQLSGGRIAYVYIPDTYDRGYPSFNRYYFAQVGKEAAIIDGRYNTGGLAADYIIDYLHRPLLNLWNMRYGADLTSPEEAIFGPKVMLINEMAGSGGDGMPWLFRRAGVGPLVGERTWGGLIGVCAPPDDLLDGGHVTTPDCAFYSPSGSWDIENHGVTPDFEVDDDPQASREGHDRQIEKGVEVALDLLKKSSTQPVRHPPYPNYQRAWGASSSQTSSMSQLTQPSREPSDH
jgi:tricorn protease